MKDLCIIHANCQGRPIADLLRRHPLFNTKYRIKHIVNYTKEEVHENDLRECRLFLYQWLSPKWESLSSAYLLSKLPSQAESICIPNLFFKHYWPLWDSKPGIDYSDTFLNTLIDKGISPSEVIQVYLKSDIFKLYNIPSALEKSEEVERQKETRCDIKILDEIMHEYRQRPLFFTINHPSLALQIKVTQGILDLVGFEHLSQDTLRNVHDIFLDFFLPIHPSVTEQLNIEFEDILSDYPVYGTRLTLKEYLLAYITCRQQGISDFIAFLMLYAQRKNSKHQIPV